MTDSYGAVAPRPLDRSDRLFRSSLGTRAFCQLGVFVLVAFSMVLSLLSQATYLPFQIALLVAAIGAIVSLVWSTHYRIENGTLTVRRLFFRKQIPLCDIKAVRRRPYPVWHGWRGDRDYALGTNAIEIELAERQVLVSPRDEGGFLAALGRPIEHANADG